MKISAHIRNSKGQHRIELKTNDAARSLDIPPKPSGYGSSANGGELLFLALATCFCNDIYREAAKRGIAVEGVEVEAAGEFEADGEPAKNIVYQAKISGRAGEQELLDLLRHTDRVAEIHNTLRMGTKVELDKAEAISMQP